MIERKIEMNSLKEILAQRPKLTIKNETNWHFTNKSWVKMKIRQPLTKTENSNENWISLFFSQNPRSLETGVIRLFLDVPYHKHASSCQLMPAHTVPRYYKLFTAKTINEKTNITISFKKNRQSSWKRAFSDIISTRLLESHKSFSNGWDWELLMIEEAPDFNDELRKVYIMRSHSELLKVVSAARSWVSHEDSVHENKILQLDALF